MTEMKVPTMVIGSSDIHEKSLLDIIKRIVEHMIVVEKQKMINKSGLYLHRENSTHSLSPNLE